MRFIILIAALMITSSESAAGTAQIPVVLEIVNSDDVDESLYEFDYQVWKMQCCKQLAIGTSSNLHYNCQTLLDDGALYNCEEWYK